MRKKLQVKDWSLKTKSTIIFLCLATLPILAVSVIFFYQSNNILRQQALETSNQNLSSIEADLNNTMREIEDISEYIIYNNEFYQYLTLEDGEATVEEFSNMNENLRAFFTFHLTNKSYFQSVFIEGENGRSIMMGDYVENENKKWIKASRELEGRVLWTDPYEVQTGFPAEEKKVISLFRQINSRYDFTNSIGEVRIHLNEQQLYDYLMSDMENDSSDLFVLREDGTLMLHADKETAGRSFSDQTLMRRIKNEQEEPFKYSYNGEDYYVSSKQLEDLYLVSMVKESYIATELSNVRHITAGIIIGTILLSILVIIGFFMFVLKPIGALTREIKRVEKGDFTARVEVASKDEIGTLSRRFNRMVQEIQSLINTKYKLELKTKESELKAMQSQINPHFLYNTLDMIRWSARLEKAPDTGKSIEDLSRIFRHTLSKGNTWVDLEDELMSTKSYLELQKRRMGAKLHYSLFVETGLEKVPVMKMIVQPLIENSIEHGMGANKQTIHIDVRAYRMKEKLIIDVIDNGLGIEALNIKELKSSSPKSRQGFALQNIEKRITNTYGEAFGLNIVPVKTGTHIQIRFPVLKEKNNELHLNQEEGEENDNENTDRGR
ncbi:sensor histidine kinase [uncultured Marinococcus sp.]|uniref:sensor histidine kinase n=1 Tax=uncultured Marinococcus sp. TaxID=487012 RepID=UPI002620B605|nr:sensor histidine kinase [uncultured Marinococcus sp.]